MRTFTAKVGNLPAIQKDWGCSGHFAYKQKQTSSNILKPFHIYDNTQICTNDAFGYVYNPIFGAVIANKNSIA